MRDTHVRSSSGAVVPNTLINTSGVVSEQLSKNLISGMFFFPAEEREVHYNGDGEVPLVVSLFSAQRKDIIGGNRSTISLYTCLSLHDWSHYKITQYTLSLLLTEVDKNLQQVSVGLFISNRCP